MRNFVRVLGLVALAAGGIAGGVFATNGGASPKVSGATYHVTVSASEFKFVLSKRSVAPGTVIFTVINKGKISHDFKIAGKKTRTLGPGQTVTLSLKFAKKGRYPYLCTLPGHAGAGMKGTFSVGVAAVAPPPPPPPEPVMEPAPPPPPPPPAPSGERG